ncbi:MAG: peroxiredoxin [Pseudomonadota bacterium]|nr:peroxiredoxin [Pseudomonadales bacterium]MDY6920062.1 peroxiredoxin [Pseudomonadota bacterium]
MATVEIGKPVPDFAAQATSQKDVVLSKLKGWKVVLYFYPKDNTPGCTTEGLDFRDYYEDFLKAKTLVFGVSKDTLKSHEMFKAQYQFPFELISDTDAYLCQMFDVIKPLNMYGKQVQGVDRSTFLLDSNGVLRREWRKVRVNGHVEEVLEAAEAID